MRIIYIEVDSLRPDHMGCYGYPRDTTPNIDRIASEGVRFNSCYCASSPCVPSRGSLISGRFGINHGALTHWGPGSEFYYPEGPHHTKRFPFFTRYIREAGYRTITFSSFADRHHAWWFSAGWNEVHSFTLDTGNENADEVNAAVIPWLQAHGKEDNYFLHIQYWDPHREYTVPKEYVEKWKDSPVKEFPTEEMIQKQQNDNFFSSATLLHRDETNPFLHDIHVHYGKSETMPKQVNNRSDLARLINAYDGSINYMDKHVGDIMNTLRELGIEDDVAFIVSADHGEAMGEQGVYMDHVHATEPVHHVPLIMKIPGVTSRKSYDEFVYNVDVVATITDFLGLDIPAGWDGQSFLPVLQGEDRPGRDYLVMEHALYTCQRAVRDRKWHFIRTYHPGIYDFPPVTLFDMEEDPHQTVNVADQYPEIVKEMDHRMNQWLHEQLGKPGHHPDPLQRVVETGPWKYTTLEEWVERLRKEGRSEAANELLKRSMKLE